MPVTLRAFTAEDLEDYFAEQFQPNPASALTWYGYGFRSRAAVERDFSETGFIRPDGGRLVVEVDGEWAGYVVWWEVRWGPTQSVCWEIGIALNAARRGRGIGTSAQGALRDYLFDHTRVHRLQAVTDIENLPEQRSLEKAGFRREAVVREAQWRAGAWHDQVLYALLRTDPVPPAPQST